MLRPLASVQARHVALFVKWALVALALAILVFFIVYAFKTRRELEVLRTQYDTHVREKAVLDKVIQEQLDAFYRTLYTDPDLKKALEPPAKTPAGVRQPSYVELWQRNRDKELRDRINRLELWRLRTQQLLNDLK